jgi:hypothetical protein
VIRYLLKAGGLTFSFCCSPGEASIWICGGDCSSDWETDGVSGSFDKHQVTASSREEVQLGLHRMPGSESSKKEWVQGQTSRS